MRNGKWFAVGAVFVIVASGCSLVTRVDVANDGSGPGAGTVAAMPAVNNDGSLVYFVTSAHLDPRDTDTTADLYLRDVVHGTTDLVTTVEDRPNAPSDPDTDGSGNLVVFRTESAIDPADENSTVDVYLYDRLADAFTRVSVATSGEIPGSFGAVTSLISADGAFVAFETTTAQSDTRVWVRDLAANTTTAVTTNGSERLIGFTNDGQRLLTLDSAGLLAVRDWAVDDSIFVPCPVTTAAIFGDGEFVIGDFADGGPDCPVGIAEADLSQPDSYNDLLGGTHGTLTARSVDDNGQLFTYTQLDDGSGPAADVGQLFVGDTAGYAPQRVSESMFGVPAAGPVGGGVISRDGNVVAFPAPNQLGDVEPASGFQGVYLHAALRPTVDPPTPASYPRGTFHAPLVIPYVAYTAVTVDLGPGVHVDHSVGLYFVTVDADAVPGPRNIVVTSTSAVSASIGICAGCFTVT